MENNKIKIKITYKNENEPQHIYCLFSIFSFCTFFFFCFLYSLLFLFFCFFPFFSYAFYILFLFLLFFFGFLFSTSQLIFLIDQFGFGLPFFFYFRLGFIHNLLNTCSYDWFIKFMLYFKSMLLSWSSSLLIFKLFNF